MTALASPKSIRCHTSLMVQKSQGQPPWDVWKRMCAKTHVKNMGRFTYLPYQLVFLAGFLGLPSTSVRIFSHQQPAFRTLSVCVPYTPPWRRKNKPLGSLRSKAIRMGLGWQVPPAGPQANRMDWNPGGWSSSIFFGSCCCYGGL